MRRNFLPTMQAMPVSPRNGSTPRRRRTTPPPDGPPAAPAAASGVERTVARRIAVLRREAGLTLGELGAKAGLSAAYLSRVENGRAAVTLATLSRLAEVFAEPPAAFLEDPDAVPPVSLTRAGAGRTVRFRGRDGTLVRLLAHDKARKLMEPLLIDVASARTPVRIQSHPGEEFIFVVRGRCRFVHGEREETLSAGDAVYFDATRPHAVHRLPGEDCEVLAVVASRDLGFHGSIGRALEDRLQF